MIIRIPKKENPNLNINEILEGIKKICEQNNFKCWMGVRETSKSYYIHLNVRLNYKCYNTYCYTASGNYYVEINEKGKPIAVNRHYPWFELRCRKMNVLQWCHWATLDNELNELLDKLNIYAFIKSAWGWIREGHEWKWIDPMNPEHEGINGELHKFHKPT